MSKSLIILEKYLQFCATFPPETLKKTMNGAGPSGKGNLVKDTLFYKFNVTEAANVHDFLYSKYGPKEILRKDADDMFLKMMLSKLKSHSVFSQFLNKPLVYAYYTSVRLFGGSFWTKEKIDW